jgi:tRNA modification GTPase
VLDASKPVPALPENIRAAFSTQTVLVVHNKIDLGGTSENTDSIGNYSFVNVSALTGAGFDDLRAAIVRHAESYSVKLGDDLIAINARHADALARAQICLADAETKLAAQDATELVASDLRGALDAFGEIAGKIDNERMLDHLFATFCIGK